MTIYVNHNSPVVHHDVTQGIIRAGVAGQQTASDIATIVIRDRLTAWRGISFVHFG